VDITLLCSPLHLDDSDSLDDNTGAWGGLYDATIYGINASVLSLSVNFFATIIVAYKAWTSRTFLRKFMLSGHRTIRMERLFSILVESGLVYCTIWMIVIAWQISVYPVFDQNLAPTFKVQFGDFIDGGLVPIIGIYPAVVIILVAQNRSHMVKAFGGGAVNIPEPSRLDGVPATRAIMLHMAQEGGEVGEGPEESSTHTTDE
ncbi:hypothetical protein BD311DRAFT_676841, partial [Dichomitus squalens]